ncbi:MAG: hypothetical protein KZQ93_05250 [Candidatus Thiodiazotropha sp. (ex Monitilora ramsayi)]|nr:hypothetical protein [Candidatus Thiodiazotropha sp. (ex Monitilora ramsayi)]
MFGSLSNSGDYSDQYLGTEVGNQSWLKFRDNPFYMTGKGKFWLDSDALHFRIYISSMPMAIPYHQIRSVSLGKTHAGHSLSEESILKVFWKKGGVELSSGFILCQSKTQIVETINLISKHAAI